MRSILYFIPTTNLVLSPELVRSAGLAYTLDASSATAVGLQNGPGGTAGVLVTAAGAAQSDGPPKYDATCQRWVRGPGGRYHVGVRSDDRPGPYELARSRIYGDAPIKLADGNEWIIPRCLGPVKDRPPTLPAMLDLAEDGETILVRDHPDFAKLLERVRRYWDYWIQTPGAAEPDSRERVQLAVDLLALNYRVSIVEAVALLSLLSTDDVAAVLRTAVDGDALEAQIKAQSQATDATPTAIADAALASVPPPAGEASAAPADQMALV
jgi:hypothetical protein